MVGCKVEKTLLSKDNKIRGATKKHFKSVVLNRRINKLYPIEWMKQTIETFDQSLLMLRKFVKLRHSFVNLRHSYILWLMRTSVTLL